MNTPGPWDLVANAYAAEVVPMFERYSAEALRLAKVPAGAAIADVACGPGTLTVLAARAGHPVSALDFSPRMVDELRARIERDRGALANVDVRVGDGMDLPWADGAFGGAFSMFGLMFFPDRGRGFRELHRVLAPGGRAVVSSWLPMDRVPVLALAFATLRELRPPPPGAPPFVPPLATPEACVAEMSAAGFRGVEVTEVVHQEISPTMKELWASFERTSAPFALVKSQLGPGWEPIGRAIEDRLVGAFGDGPVTMTMPAFLTVGVR
jgi:ubiquinone/menaquinone biosynthesis C-methylase UbiE